MKPTNRRAPARGPGAAGFTLVEMLVVLFIVTLLLAAIVALFDMSARIARVQTQLADMQQSLRIAQYDMIRNVRMAGRGGLPRGTLPNGLALSIRNEISATGAEARVVTSDPASPEAVAGSDIITVRGVFSSPIFQVNPAAGVLVLEGDQITGFTGGRLTIRNPSPSGVPQDLGPLIDAVNDELPEALLLVSPLGSQIYAVVELDPGHANTDVSDPANVTLQFKIVGGDNTDGYQAISANGGFPPALQAVAAVGILEEHRYYVRKEYQVPGDSTTEEAPRLSRARLYPGTDNPYAGTTASYALDIADNILDLQVALGVDRDNSFVVDEADPPSSADDWVFNSADDDETDAAQVASWNTLASGDPTELYYLRITTLARTGRRDVSYLAPPITRIEDKAYTEFDAPGTTDEQIRRMYHRQLLRTIVDLRNLS